MKEFDYSIPETLPESESENFYHHLGEMVVTEGTIAVGDPYSSELKNLIQKIKPGTYPVISSGLPNNEAIFILLSDKSAVHWENALLTSSVQGHWYGTDFQGYEVNSHYGCFVNAEDTELLGKVLRENDWLVNPFLIETGTMFFYVDLGDKTFCELTNQLVAVQKELQQIAGWKGLPGDYERIATCIDQFKDTHPEKASEIDNMLAVKQDLIARLTSWTEIHGFGNQMHSTRALWDKYEEDRLKIFRGFRHIVFDNENRTSAFLFILDNGTYPTFFGHNKEGEICTFITDFGGIGFPVEDD